LEPGAEERARQPRRRGGRAAIRSRGGEREIIPEPPREAAPERPSTRPYVPDSPLEPEAERLRPTESELARERYREPERAREPESEPPRERPARPHDRAGEPGYVPRRERSRKSDFGAGVDLAGVGRPEGSFEAEPVAEPELEGTVGETGGSG